MAFAELLTDDAPVAIETEENIGNTERVYICVAVQLISIFIAIKTELTTRESINAGNSLSFPNSDDDISLFGGHTTSVMLPNRLLRSVLNNLPLSKYIGHHL